jgi:CheY-like chemotaxis protein
MDNPISEIDKVRSQLMTLERPQKLKILVVDDEPDNLDLLYRTFRRDFHVLKADSGINALEVLAASGEVAVIISDQRMPEMKGTEFLSKTLPQFPDTVRIILTGFTDIEDLVEAINAGQVYKYITKPWEPSELKTVVQRAAEAYELHKQRTEELCRVHAQIALLIFLVQVTETTPNLEASLTSIATAFCQTFTADGCILQLVENNAFVNTQGTCSNTGTIKNWLDQDPLTTEAIASRKIQFSANVPKHQKLAGITQYQDNQVEAHLIIPMIYRSEVFAVLSLQWKQPCTLREDELELIHTSAQLVAIALTSTRCYQATK